MSETALNKQAEVEASAPGRVNLMGEHTDYNDGLVLPMVIPQRTKVRLRPRQDARVIVVSAQQAEPAEYALGREVPRKSWIDYVQGVTFALQRAGHALGGFEASIDGAVPLGAGLSSSAALEVALLRALRAAFQLALTDQEIALLGRAAETDFMGIPIGIMDQVAASLGQPDAALLLDTRTGHTRAVPLPRALELAVIASGVTHANDTSGYKQRREECMQAAAALGVVALRDATLELLEQRALAPTLRKRARHVISESARVEATVRALADADLPALRALFAASHASQRDDYEVSVPAVDALVALAERSEGVVGARLTGGGFGGSVVMLVERGRALAASLEIAERYRAETGHEPSVLLPVRG